MSEIGLDAHASQEAEDENYFVSMTDMMVGMLFLFIIMLMMFALNFRKGDEDAERIRDCLQAVVNENAALSADVNTKIASVQQTIRGPIEALQVAADQRQKLLTDIKSQLEAQGIQQVETAVTQIDQVTQSNAASAEEGASAAEELNVQASALKEAIRALMSLVGALRR